MNMVFALFQGIPSVMDNLANDIGRLDYRVVLGIALATIFYSWVNRNDRGRD